MKHVLGFVVFAVVSFAAAAQQPPLFSTTNERLAGYASGLAANVERFCSYWGRGY